MTEIQKYLFSIQDIKYKAFQGPIVPTVDPETIIGVRVPLIRAYAKALWKESAEKEGKAKVWDFLSVLPHKYYEENLLHGFLLEFIKDFEEAVQQEDRFLPFIDNWAVCDTTHPKVFKKNPDKLFPWVKKWISSSETYTVRYGINMLMSFFLDENFLPEHLDLVISIKSEEYYINMMRAWYLATALAKQWETTVKVIENRSLDVWTHNKTIQKAVESFRVSDEHKSYLKTMRIKQNG